MDGPLPKLCPAVALSHQDGHHSAVALLLKAALIQVSDYRLLGASGLITESSVVQSVVGKSLRLVMTQWVRHLATSLLESSNDKIFSWSRFQRLSCPLTFFYIPGLVHAMLQSNNDRVAYIESFSSLSVLNTTNYHSSRLPSFYI